jgi:predicted alpha/beta-hydrolase family hydrolase
LREIQFALSIRVPKFFVQSTNDEFGPRADLDTFFESLAEPKQLEWITASDHFFRDNLDGFEAAIECIGRARCAFGSND